jgi:DNA-directed RNA polymerase subunit RPC12/RpoP
VLDCHQCSRQFVALVDYSLTGNHIIECPTCGHEHCRLVENGKITEERWSTRYGDDKSRGYHRPRRVWKADSLQARTSSAAEFIRQKWLDRSQL